MDNSTSFQHFSQIAKNTAAGRPCCGKTPWAMMVIILASLATAAAGAGVMMGLVDMTGNGMGQAKDGDGDSKLRLFSGSAVTVLLLLMAWGVCGITAGCADRPTIKMTVYFYGGVYFALPVVGLAVVWALPVRMISHVWIPLWMLMRTLLPPYLQSLNHDAVLELYLGFKESEATYWVWAILLSTLAVFLLGIISSSMVLDYKNVVGNLQFMSSVMLSLLGGFFLRVQLLFVMNTTAPPFVYAMLAPIILLCIVGIQGLFVCHKIVVMWIYIFGLVLACITLSVFGVIAIMEEDKVAEQLSNRSSAEYSSFVSSLNMAAFTEDQLVQFFSGGVLILGVCMIVVAVFIVALVVLAYIEVKWQVHYNSREALYKKKKEQRDKNRIDRQRHGKPIRKNREENLLPPGFSMMMSLQQVEVQKMVATMASLTTQANILALQRGRRECRRTKAMRTLYKTAPVRRTRMCELLICCCKKKKEKGKQESATAPRLKADLEEGLKIQFPHEMQLPHMLPSDEHSGGKATPDKLPSDEHSTAPDRPFPRPDSSVRRAQKKLLSVMGTARGHAILLKEANANFDGDVEKARSAIMSEIERRITSKAKSHRRPRDDLDRPQGEAVTSEIYISNTLDIV